MLPDRKIWAQEFVNDDFIRRVDNYLDSVIAIRKSKPTKILFSSDYAVDFSRGENNGTKTPREFNLFLNGNFKLDTFYYVDYIIKNSTGSIYDIGCGSNVFKYFFQDVIGVDCDNLAADVAQEFNDDFVEENQKKLPNAIAINSLHFISITKFKSRLQSFASCISPGGYGYITFNIERILAFTAKKDVPENIQEYIENQIADAKLNILSLDLFQVDLEGNNGLDGNIRILFKV